MSLSLEVKKFVNSESIGEFVTVVLPGEVPAANEQVRAMNRERAAASKASKAATACEEAERRARGKADKAAASLAEAKAALAEQEKALEQQAKDHDKLKAEHDKKKAVLDKAKKALDGMTERKFELLAALAAANEAFSAAEKAKTEAEERLAAIKAAEQAKKDAEKKEAENKTEENKTEEKEATAEEKPVGEEGSNKAAENAEKSDADESGQREAVGAEAESAEGKTEEKAKEAEANAEEKTEAAQSEKAEAKPAKTQESQAEESKSEKAETEKTESAKPDEEKTEVEKPEEEKNEAEQEPAMTLEEAEAERKKAKAAFDKAKAALEKAQKEGAGAEETAEKLRREHDTLEAEFSRINALFVSAANELERAKAERGIASERVKSLEKSEGNANSALAEAQKASVTAAKEAERLKAAVRTLKSEQECASMHYLESGKGETLILIHTVGQSLFTFRNVFNKLAMNYHVIAPDLMGHGFSDRPDYFDYSAASHAESIMGLMDALGIERAHLLGFSLGAGYALETARRYPERIMSVIALSPGGVTGHMPLSVRMMESAVFGGVASRLFRVKTVEKLLDECLFDHTVIGAHEVSEYYKCVCDGKSRRAIRLSLSGFGEKQLLASLGEVRTEVLVVSGDMDRWHTTEQGEEYAAALEHAEFTVMRNAGHLLHEEKPDRTAELVRSFIPAGYGDYDGRELP